MVEAAMARLTRPPRIPDELPRSLAYTLGRMTQREPADRPTAAEARQMLHAPAPTLPWATERLGFTAAGVLRRWHRAAPADRGKRGRLGAVASKSSPLDPTVRDTGVPHRPGPTGPRKILAAAGLSPASDPAKRRRFTAAAGLTAAAVAALSALLLSAQEPGTSTPAQPPAPSSPASTRPSSGPLAGSGTPDASPGATESADLEPAAVTHESQAAPETTKPGKPPKTETHGKGKGKGPGRA
jgi:hypothetical protein